MGSYEVPARCADPRGYARVDHEACVASDPEPALSAVRYLGYAASASDRRSS